MDGARESSGPPRASAPALLSAWLVLALVAWRAPAGLARFAGELLGTPLSERVRARVSSVEERLRATRPDDVELWLALADKVPPGGELFVLYAEDERGKELFRGLQRLRALLCPTRLRGQGHDPRRPRATRLAPGWSGLVLDFDSGFDLASAGAVEELARGPGFRLVRLAAREAPR